MACIRIVILHLLFTVIIQVSHAQHGDYTLFRGANVIQMSPSRILHNQDLLVHGDQIVSISPTGALAYGDTITIIDSQGQFLTPGLIDAHTHIDRWVTGAVFSDSLLYTIRGVTTVLNLRGDKEVLRVRDSLRSAGASGLHPDLYTCGEFINEPDFSLPDSVAAEVMRQHHLGYDFIKMHGNLSARAFQRLHETARKLDIRVIGHAPRNLGMKPVFEQRQALAHAEEFMYTTFSPSRTMFWQVLLLTGVGIIVILFLLTIGIGIARLINRKRHEQSKLLNLLYVRVIAGFVLTLLVLPGYLFSVPPFAPFFLNSAAVRLLLMTCSFLLFFTSYSQLKLLPTLKAKGIRVFYYAITALVLLFGFISIYWTTLCFRTSDKAIERVAAATADADIFVCPNLIAYKTIADSHFPERLERFKAREEMRYLTPHNRSWFLAEDPQKAIKAFVAPGFEKQIVLSQRLVLELHNNGVPFLAGTDTGIYWVFPGTSLQEELILLVNAGVTPEAALQSATINAAKFLRKEAGFGDLKVGLRADIILLKENPLEHIENIKKIRGVMVRGRWISDNAIHQIKEEIASNREK